MECLIHHLLFIRSVVDFSATYVTWNLTWTSWRIHNFPDSNVHWMQKWKGFAALVWEWRSAKPSQYLLVMRICCGRKNCLVTTQLECCSTPWCSTVGCTSHCAVDWNTEICFSHKSSLSNHQELLHTWCTQRISLKTTLVDLLRERWKWSLWHIIQMSKILSAALWGSLRSTRSDCRKPSPTHLHSI